MPPPNRINNWLDQYLYQSGIDPKTLIRKKLTWIWMASACGGVLVMTLLSYFLGVWTLVWFGLVLLAYYAAVLPLMRVVRDFEKLNFVFLILVILTAFVTILQLGGITKSMGLVFVGLACAMSSVLMSQVRSTVIIFTVYALTVIAAGILQPYLEVPPENTPSLNLLFHVINILWLSGSSLSFTIDYMKQRSQLEEAESGRLKELNEAKTKLYTNITHEFRTPLTIILGMAKQIRENPKDWFGEGMDMIDRNGQSLLHLVNQMLDLQKVEAGVMPLHLVQGDIIPFLAYVTHSFSSLAGNHKIGLHFQTEMGELILDFDPDKWQNILSNLLSNAIKFTPESGEITVSADTCQETGFERLILKVKDSGIGIPADELPYIFERFYQIKQANAPSTGGSGIGLALTRELVKLMGGDISVASLLGQGTTFTVKFPVTRNAPSQDFKPDQIPLQDHAPAMLPTTLSDGASTNGNPLVLVVEDNTDMVRYLTTCLQPTYLLEIANDGKEGLEKALLTIPDIIISDVMMPEMDGFELCKQLKKDFRTSHIPIVLLTAKADQISKLEGLECGADAYLTKPFYQDELLLRLRKLIELRQQLQKRYATSESLPPTDDQTIHREDDFIQKVRRIAEDNLCDENFGIHELCHELGMSRAQLYRKFEALTNVPVGKFIRTMRLHKAKELLNHNGMNVTEAALETGFRNVSHFSAAFKEEFGISPSEEKHH